jgi:hypothetical protein
MKFHRPMCMLFLSALLIVMMSACNLSSETTPAPDAIGDEDAQRVVLAWVDAGNLIVWQTGDNIGRRIASGGVIQPIIAPDGQHVAFTRGPAGIAESLWVVDVAGTAERQIAGGDETPAFQAGTHLIGDVQWYDAVALYFNTVERQMPAPTPRDDLYRANINTREVALILPRGEGGVFSISPDNNWIAVASAGTYGRQDGAIRVIDPLAQRDARRLLFYIGVATGGHSPFYPYLQWADDSSAVLTSIPDADLLYSDTNEGSALPPTNLWRLPIENPSGRTLLGSVQASFFGLPRWSSNASVMTYLQRQAGSNDFALITADGDGANEQNYLLGRAGSLGAPQWLPASNEFLYQVDDSLYIASTDSNGVWQTGDLLTQEIVYAPTFVSSAHYVFVTSAAVASDGFQFRLAQRGEASRFLVAIGAQVPVYDVYYRPSSTMP